MQPLPELAKLFERSRQLRFGVDDPLVRPGAGRRQSHTTQGLSQFNEPALRTVVKTTLEPPPFLVPCKKYPPS